MCYVLLLILLFGVYSLFFIYVCLERTEKGLEGRHDELAQHCRRLVRAEEVRGLLAFVHEGSLVQ